MARWLVNALSSNLGLYASEWEGGGNTVEFLRPTGDVGLLRFSPIT